MTNDEALVLIGPLAKEWAELCGGKLHKISWEKCKNKYWDSDSETLVSKDENMLIAHITNQDLSTTFNVPLHQHECDSLMKNDLVKLFRRRWVSEIQALWLYAENGLQSFQSK